MPRGLKARWASGESTVGAWCMIPSALSAEAIARCGFDFVVIDMQHGFADFTTAVHMLQALDVGGVAPVVRVPSNEPSIIGRLLDAGAEAIIVPMVNSAAEARAAASACRYAPVGQRSFGPVRAAMRAGPSYFASANEDVALLVMIETQAALDCVDAIIATQGVDAAFVGPFDLSVSLGLTPGDQDGEPAFASALTQVLASCRKHGRVAGILANGANGAHRLEQGFRFVPVSLDLHAMTAAMAADLKRVRTGAQTC